MRKRMKSTITLIAGSLVMVAACYVGYVSLHGGNQGAAAAGANDSDPAQMLRITLDPKRFQGEVREAYTVAQNDPALLVQLHCYCGCDRDSGHKNLLDCFRNEHGSKCAICVGEAKDAEKMANRGTPIEQIRDTLRARYAHGS
jgi:hypothetical protein